ncbi:hypothetical protein G6O69_07510 [Pseudenhygromyxa sp. WMMC2535]|uniref:hypothetical protein n=1 Tax=Pseudenhygromyxa sp. WMMC2535 TaxID=2712867 RepID=UPI001555306C|nr:hypothetical protein [Pseudenhygromyxa sp. WMMC2535]NVB37675.1 hypothetical protein [Pseudenhygromyxa sp. WMMC2535]
MQGKTEVETEKSLDYPNFPPVDPGSIEEAVVFHADEVVGDGYPRVAWKLGPKLHAGKWLGFAGGADEFLGEHHIIVSHYARKPRGGTAATIESSVLLNVNTGEVSAEFVKHLDASWRQGMALVEVEGERGPMLLDVEGGALVSVLPEGEHEYRFGKNYWVRFSSIARRIWIYAKDRDGKIHLYEWEDRSKPPPLPDNPFPFFPDLWEQTHGRAAFEEVRGEGAPSGCPRAALVPPRGYECLTDAARTRSMLFSGNWRFSVKDGVVFNQASGEGVDLESLCPSSEWGVGIDVIEVDPPMLQVCCADQEKRCWVWSPENIYALSEVVSGKLIAAQSWLRKGEEETLDLYDYGVAEKGAWVDQFPEHHAAYLIGDDYACDGLSYRSSYGNPRKGVMCMSEKGDVTWAEVVDSERKVRTSRARNVEGLATSSSGRVVALVRRGGVSHVSLVDLE